MGNSHESDGNLPEVGTVFHDRYYLRSMLARGGMGTVYAAEDRESGESIAVKVLHPKLQYDLDVHRRFRREASVLQALNHPGIVRVHDLGTDRQGRSFTTMELLQGQTLSARQGESPSLTSAELLSILGQVCEALGAAHEHGVIHGDVKPDNIFLTPAPEGGLRTKLLDFGLSKVHGLERLTRTGEVIGTPIYMAPELLTGAAEVNQSIDTYAIGVILYEALAGRSPFVEKNPGKLIYQIATGAYASLETVAPQTPAPLTDIVFRAMKSHPGDRYMTAQEMKDDFDRFINSSR